MNIRDGESYIELEVTERMPAGTPGAGDSRFTVRVRMTGGETSFRAESWAWVERGVLAEFARQLRQLEDLRQGSASLESMSPGELELDIRSLDPAGHMGVFGQVAHSCYGGAGGPHRSEVAFGLAFCPSELPALVREFEALVAEGDE
jgi:hypothetical protein